MEEFLNIKPGSIEDIIGAISPAVYDNLKQAVELGKWSNGVMLSKTQVEYCMQLIILYESKYVSDDEKIGKELPGCKSQVEVLSVRPLVNEGSGENFFLVKDNKLVTPKLVTVLDGITRKTIIQLAKDLDIETLERNISVDEVYECDEAFFTGTAAEVTPIIEVDDNKINNGLPGPLTKKLQANYFNLIRGKHDKYNEWLTRVEKK